VIVTHLTRSLTLAFLPQLNLFLHGCLSVLHSFPPKIVWIRRGNCKTSDIENILRNNLEAIEELENNEQHGLITLF